MRVILVTYLSSLNKDLESAGRYVGLVLVDKDSDSEL